MVDKFYKNVLEARETVSIHKSILEEEQKSLEKLTKEYRLASVHRVLDHIRSEYRKGRLCDLETLLCHCQNKLNGNIDGIELELKEGEPFTIEKLAEMKGK